MAIGESSHFGSQEWDFIHRQIIEAGGRSLTKEVFRDESKRDFHALGAAIQADAQESLKRLEPAFYERWFGEETEIEDKEEDCRPMAPLGEAELSPISRPVLAERVTMEVEASPLEVQLAPIRSENATETRTEHQVSEQADTDVLNSEERALRSRVEEEKEFARGHLGTTSKDVDELLKECETFEARQHLDPAFINDLLSLRTRIAIGVNFVNNFGGAVTRDSVSSAVEQLRQIIVSHASDYHDLNSRRQSILDSAQVDRVTRLRQRVLAELQQHREDYHWMRESIDRQTDHLPGRLNELWEDVGEYFTDRASTAKAIGIHAKSKLALAGRLRQRVLAKGLPSINTWQGIEAEIEAVESEINHQNFPPQLVRMLQNKLRIFTQGNDATNRGLETGARFVGMAASEGGKYLLSLSFPGFIPLIHAGWSALEESSYQTTLNGADINPGQILWKSLNGALSGVLSKQTTSLGKAFGDTVVRSKIVTFVSDHTLRAFSKVFAAHAVETVKDGFILGPIHEVLRRQDAAEIVTDPERLGQLILKQIERKFSLHEVSKTLIETGLGEARYLDVN